MTRAHSFPCSAVNRGICVFSAVVDPRNLPPNSSFSAEFDVFHSNNYFSTENDLKVALLQVCS